MKKVMIASAAFFIVAITSVDAQTTQAVQPTTDKKEMVNEVSAVQTNQSAQPVVADKKEKAVTIDGGVTSQTSAGNVTPVPVETTRTNPTAQPVQPEKTPVKTEVLPEAVKTVIAGTDYKGWVVNAAFLVKATSEYYELVLTKDKETKTVKMDKNGKPI